MAARHAINRSDRTTSATVLRNGSIALLLFASLFLVYGLVRTYSTHRYLKGFSDAIVPLDGSPQSKTEALLAWFRHTPSRTDTPFEGASELRDPVNIVQNETLLKICGSASNAFLNLADAAGLNTRRLLLLDSSGSTMHVVTEVEWDNRWIVVDPQHGRAFMNSQGKALTKEELSDPRVFQEAISRIPGYSPGYTFERTAHLHLERVPLVGSLLERSLNRVFPTWQEAIDWGYLPENPEMWPIALSLPLFLLALLLHIGAVRHQRRQLRPETMSYDQMDSALAEK